VNSLVILAAALLFVFTLETDMPRRRLHPVDNLNFYPVMSYSELAEALGRDEGKRISRQRVEVICRTAVAKFRSECERRGLKASDLLPDG
jgi:hypothetical protein